MTGLLRGFGFSSKAKPGFGGTIQTQPTSPPPPPPPPSGFTVPLYLLALEEL